MLACLMVAAGLSVQAVFPASAATGSSLTRYPYLTDAVGSNVTVNWATDRSGSTGAVDWGKVDSTGCTPNQTTAATKTGINVGGTLEYQWKATFSVGTASEFCYRVYLGSTDLLGTDPTLRARPQVPAGSSEAYTFAVLGDTGQVDTNGDNADQANLMQKIANSGARFAVQTGDFGHPNNDQRNFGDLDQKAANTSAVFGPGFWKNAGARIPMFTVPGNHGVTSNSMLVNFPQTVAVTQSSGKYQMEDYCCTNGTSLQSQQSGWYAFDAGKARYYMLTTAWSDTNLGNLVGTTDRSTILYQNDYDNHWTPSSQEYQWLEADLQAHADSAVKLAFFHFPLYSDQKAEHSDENLQGASSLEGLLGRYGVDIAFSGHAHTYQRNRSSQGLVSYVTGGGGANLESIGASCSTMDLYGIGWSRTNGTGNRCGSAPLPVEQAHVFHYLLVTVNGTNVTVTPTDSTGATFDVKTYDLSTKPIPPKSTTTSATVTPSTVVVNKTGCTVAATVTTTDGSTVTNGSVKVLAGGVQLGAGDVNDGKALVTLPPFDTVRTVPLTVEFTGSSLAAPSSTTVPVNVVKGATTTTATVTPSRGVVRQTAARVVATVMEDGAPVTGGSVNVYEGTKHLATASATDGTATATLPKFTTVGARTLSVEYEGTDTLNPSTTTVRISVVRAKPKMKVVVKPTRVHKSRTQARLNITLTAPGQTVTGYVAVRSGGRLRALVHLKAGQAIATLPVFRTTGRHKVTLRYRGSSLAYATSKTIVIRVVR